MQHETPAEMRRKKAPTDNTGLTLEQHQQVYKKLEGELITKYDISETNYNHSEKQFPNTQRRRRTAQGTFEGLKIAVWEWMRTACDTNNHKRMPQQWLVREKARELARSMGLPYYHVSESWARNTRRAFRDQLKKEAKKVPREEAVQDNAMPIALNSADSSVPSKQETLEAFDTIRQVLQGSDHVPSSVFGFMDMLQTFYGKDFAFKCHEKLTSARDS